jgi:GT2 family glycosyltransferase
MSALGGGRGAGFADRVLARDTLSGGDRDAIRDRIGSLPRRPLLSVVLPVEAGEPTPLVEAIASIRSQLYEQWELLATVDRRVSTAARALLGDIARSDPRVRLTRLRGRRGVASASNAALASVSGEWSILFRQDDVLAEHALYLVAEAIIKCPGAAIVYSDEAELDERDNRVRPWFKPDWDYDLFLGRNLLGRLTAFRTDLVRAVGGLREGFDGAEDWELGLRILEAAPHAPVCHVPFVLCHRRRRGAPRRASKALARDAGARAVNEHFRRTGQAAVAGVANPGAGLRIRRAVPEPRPLVSVVVPTKDQPDLLRACVQGLRERTGYQPLDLVVVDNGSTDPRALALLDDLGALERVTVVTHPGAFNFSRLCNRGVAAARGEVCVLLNNDVEVIDRGWLDELVSHAVRVDVGAVGAKLYFPDGTLQHAGVVLGRGAVAGHVYLGAPGDEKGYFDLLTLTHSVSAVTAACLATRRAVYEEVGGFDERLAVEYNDVDYCLRVRERGYKILWTPHAELIHQASASRARRKLPAERAHMRERWGAALQADPFYNPNLALRGKPFRPAEEPRVRKPWLDPDGSAGGSVDRRSSPAPG